jgi:hypothetical protein
MMNNELFMKLLHGVREYDTYFVMNKDVVRVSGYSSIPKFTATMKMIAYGALDDT